MTTQSNHSPRSIFTLSAMLFPLLLSLLLSACQHQAATVTTSPSVAQQRVSESYGKLPLNFEANQGQTDKQVKFLAHGQGYGLFLTPTETVLNLRSANHSTATLRMKLAGAQTAKQIVGREALPGRSNYFLGNDPAQWQTNVPSYAKVEYDEVYPGIDLVYYGKQRELEYDFVVAPGANPKAIKLTFDGVQQISLNPEGELVLQMEGGEIRQHKPVIYQEDGVTRQEITGRYVINPSNEVGFEVSEYDARRPLIIDPVLVYSTYFGGPEGRGSDIAVDSAGNAYLTGTFSVPEFSIGNMKPTILGGGKEDIFVAKLNAAGTALVYLTFIGGSASDKGNGLALDSDGNAYLTGETASSDFPVSNARQKNYGGGENDAFVAKLNPSGSALVYATFLGGANSDFGSRIAVDNKKNACVIGTTKSTNFPTANALQPNFGGQSDAFVVKLNATGAGFVYSTYLGGNNPEAPNGFSEQGWDIAVDSGGNAYVTGETVSPDFPTAHAIQPNLRGRDAFIAKINDSGTTFIYSTFLGGNGASSGHGIATDSAGNAYITGETTASDFPTRNAFQPNYSGGLCLGSPCPDAFVAKLNTNGSALLYSTYLGGKALNLDDTAGNDAGRKIAVDNEGNAYLIGDTTSANFPIVNAIFPTFKGGRITRFTEPDVFVAKLDGSGAILEYSTYLPGNSRDTGGGIAVDNKGGVYVVGSTSSDDFPTRNALQPSIKLPEPIHVPTNPFVAKISDATVNQPPTVALTSPANKKSFTEGTPITLQANAADSDGTVSKVEFFEDGKLLGTDASAPFALTLNNVAAGGYQFFAKATDEDGAVQLSAPVQIVVSKPPLPPSSFSVKINFQTANAFIPTGYLADKGEVFGNRGNGFSYGWNIAHTDSLRNRDHFFDQRYDTHVFLKANAVWEIAVPNGTYKAHLVAGDPDYFNSVYRFNVEGVLALSGTPSSAARWVENVCTVNVTDGRLTVSNAAGAMRNKLCFIEIVRQ